MLPQAENQNKNEITIQRLLDGFSFDNSRNTFVPKEVYQESDKSKYLEILGLTDADSVVCADFVEEAEAYNVYAITKEEYDYIQSLSKDLKVRHASSVVVAELIRECRERTDDTRVFLNIKDQNYEMIVLKGSKLLFFNHFRFKTKEDFLYFLLFAMEQLSLDAGSVPVYFIGMIEEDSSLVELTKRYVRDVRFKKDLRCES